MRMDLAELMEWTEMAYAISISFNVCIWDEMNT